jgi:hypothetical protein
MPPLMGIEPPLTLVPPPRGVMGFMSSRQLYHLHHFLHGLRQHHYIRQMGPDGGGIIGIGQQVFLGSEDIGLSTNRFQLSDNLRT